MSNTSTKDKVVVGGALVGGLLFFGFLTNTCNSPFSTGTDKTTPSLASTSDDGNNTEYTAIDNATLKKQLADTSAKLDASNKALKSQTGSLKETIEGLELEVDTANSTINSLKSKLGSMTGSADATDSLQEKVDQLSADLALTQTKNRNLRDKLAAMSAETPSAEAGASDKVTALTATIKGLETKNQGLTADLAKLNGMLKTAQSGNGDLNKLTNENTKLTGHIEKLYGERSKLQADLKLKNTELGQLKAQVNQFKAQKNVFVQSSDDLPNKAKSLFGDLKTLEGKSTDQVNAEYTQYLQKHNAKALARIKFNTGKSAVSEADIAQIANLTQTAGENSYFLIVGYADLSGDAAGNQKLSSKRSTSVAKALAEKAKGFQAAQAVYLGQTDRFGAPAENRVVEIWEMK